MFLQATDLFQWDRSAERFMAPLQRDREKKRAAAAVHSQRQEKVKFYLLQKLEYRKYQFSAGCREQVEADESYGRKTTSGQ